MISDYFRAVKKVDNSLVPYAAVTPLRGIVLIEEEGGRYLAYMPGLKGLAPGEGTSREEALSRMDVAIRAHAARIGKEMI